MRAERAVLDVSRLPTVTFGNRDLVWWGTLGFVVIEGWTLALVLGAYLYVHKNFYGWPPLRTLPPSLTWPTVGVVVMLASLPVVVWTQRASRRLDLGKVRLGLALLTAFAAAFLVFRGLDFLALNVRWDTNAYGSAAWNVLGFHATLLLLEFGEVAGTLALFFTSRLEEKHFSDVNDLAFYWWFMVLAWIPLYVVVYFSPRWWT